MDNRPKVVLIMGECASLIVCKSRDCLLHLRRLSIVCARAIHTDINGVAHRLRLHNGRLESPAR